MPVANDSALPGKAGISIRQFRTDQASQRRELRRRLYEPQADQELLPAKGLAACKFVARAAVLAALAAIVAHQICLVFDLNYKNYGEGPILAFVERMQSESISASWASRPPYALSCYGPAFYWLADAAARASGFEHSVVPGRAVALATGLLTACLAAVIAGRRTQSVEIGLLAALMFLASLPVAEWFPFARVDTLALVFSAGAFLAVGPGVRGAVLPALLIAAGSLAKPTAALSAAPIFLHFLAHARYRDAARFAGAACVLGAAAWGGAEWASDGFFLTSVLKGNRNPMILWRGYSHAYAFLSSPLGAVATITSAVLLVASPARFVRSLYSLGFAVSMAISAVIACKKGSELNYFLDPAWLGSLAIAIEGLPRLRALDARRSLLAAAFLAALVAVPYLREMKVRYRSPLKRPETFEVVRRCLADEPAETEVLADGKTIPMVLETGRRPWVSDPYLYALLVDNGTLDPAPLIERIEDGRIKWLIFRRSIEFHHENTGCWPPEATAIFPKYFELASTQAGLFIYRHR
ncbi:MAG TPA: hypothetical protein VMV10_06530 [Pirellulales bacterium]|nr:hypothetical protein [Pirellulales bacterium]